jgi:cytochrome c-type biogenesis protein
MADVSFPAALLAGLVSFLSPCVLPLVPPYLCYLAGSTFEHLAAREEPPLVARREITGALLFVLGFTVVFVALGAGASAIGGAVRAYSAQLSILAGIVIIAMGLHFLGLFQLPFMLRTMRFETGAPVGLWGAFVMGLAFAFGWTPCLGSVLGAILAVAASENTVAMGATLLAVYSLGLGIPFVLAALAIKPFIALLARYRRHLAKIEKAMGGLLVLTGIAFLTGAINQAAYWLLEAFPALGQLG